RNTDLLEMEDAGSQRRIRLPGPKHLREMFRYTPAARSDDGYRQCLRQATGDVQRKTFFRSIVVHRCQQYLSSAPGDPFAGPVGTQHFRPNPSAVQVDVPLTVFLHTGVDG